MDIVASIIKLLAQQNSVEVATIGTWYQKKVPGKFDPIKQYFFPPTFEIRFHKLENGDQSLIEFLQKENNISKSDAELLLRKFSQQIWQQLADQKIADLTPLGTLNLIDDQLIFNENPNYASPNQFFGLPNDNNIVNKPTDNKENKVEVELGSVETENNLSESDLAVENPPTSIQTESIEEVNEAATEENVTTEVEADEVVTDEVWKPTVNQKYEYDPSDDEDDESSSSKRSILKWIIYIIIALAILSTLAYIFYPRYFDNLYRKINPPKYQLENELYIDTPKHKASDIVVDTTKIDSLLKSLDIDSTSQSQVLTRYEIIGGAMKTHKKADEIIANYTKRGIAAKKLLNTGGKLIKISLGSYIDYNVADKAKDSLRNTLKNPDLYIQTIKPKN